MGLYETDFSTVLLALHIPLSLMFQRLDSIGKKVSNSRYDAIIISFQSMNFSAHPPTISARNN